MNKQQWQEEYIRINGKLDSGYYREQLEEAQELVLQALEIIEPIREDIQVEDESDVRAIENLYKAEEEIIAWKQGV